MGPLSVLVKICQIPCHFLNHKSLFLQILHHFSVFWNMTPLYFFSSDIVYPGQKEPIKVKMFDIFECSGQNLSNSSCQFWNEKSISLRNFASLFNVMTHNSSVDFKLIHFLLCTKGSHQSSNFNTFKCSGENLANSSCHFPNHKSVFLQILHHSSVS